MTEGFPWRRVVGASIAAAAFMFLAERLIASWIEGGFGSFAIAIVTATLPLVVLAVYARWKRRKVGVRNDAR
jgi:ABC-type spermidine/putrescine transport system permease subunit II